MISSFASLQAGLEMPETILFFFPLCSGGKPHQLDFEPTEDHLDPHSILEAKQTTKTCTILIDDDACQTRLKYLL